MVGDTYVDRIVLLKLRSIFSFAHQHQDRGGTIEERVSTPLVSLPCRYKVRQTFLEESLVDFDICHSEGGSVVMVEGGVEEEER